MDSFSFKRVCNIYWKKNRIKMQFTFTVHVVFVLLLHTSVLLGLINEWLDLFDAHIWLLWFLSHSILYSVYVVLTEFTIKVQPRITQHLVVHPFFMALWYLQRIHVFNYLSVENYELNCKQDLLMATSSISFTILLLSLSALFTRLVL